MTPGHTEVLGLPPKSLVEEICFKYVLIAASKVESQKALGREFESFRAMVDITPVGLTQSVPGLSRHAALMGDTGSRRSTLVSRLPIFRRSTSKRRDSLPSSPSSATNGVHTSSPSSTNSSSSSMGKRRNIFRTASIGFPGRKAAGEPRASTLCNGQGNSPGEEGARAKGRHTFGLSVVPRGKKITRSATEDFEKGKELNKSVFMNCLSSGRSSVDEGDDSGFPDDRPAKQRGRKLLPRSFSTHHKLSKPSAARSPPAEQPAHVMLQADELEPRGPAHEECSKYLQVDNTEGSLHSPLLSSDNTTILTPSEFVPVSADSVSEADKELLACRPAPTLTELDPALPATPLNSLGPAPTPHLCPSEDGLPLRETALLSDVELSTPHAEEFPPGFDCPGLKGSCESDGRPTQPPGAVTQSVPYVKHQPSFTQNGLEATTLSTEKVYELAITNSIPMIKPHEHCQGTSHSTVTVNRAFSPRHEEKWVERRLRSSSEGTSGRRLSHGVRDGRVEELHSLKGQRAGSSSSKMNSMDVLNRLGSCDLDEDDLMLDLEFLEDQHRQCDRDTTRHIVCREDSNHSIKSCVEILHVPTELKMKIEGPKVPETPKELPFIQPSKEGEFCESRPLRYNHWPSAASSDWSLLREDEPGGGLEAMSLRLMMQDCTAVKTMLLKLKRILQESVEMSPASSTHSLPVSPITEMPIPFKVG
ncbi:serine-rich coiled-coil domain-containing protein 1 [Rhincodon typus]|uniref:serine-rich coiled-coil domain-containing protein 1 n=1 Tax=Rhincodon typus TaxID=259920 RepID=UPI00202F017D|nr:serine-rich coiled-coil domain-containing protein 1 [Rhincodon typus]